MRRILWPFTAACLLLFATTAPSCFAQDSPAPEIDLSGSLDAAPWFDSEKGELRPIEVIPREDDSIHRDSRWRPKPKKLKEKPAANNANTNVTAGPGLFGSNFTIGNLFGWVLLLVTLVGIVALVAYFISRAEMKFGEGAGDGKDGSGEKGLPDKATLERIKHLPPELRRTDVNLKTECERLMNEGRFEQAIILLLGHQLLLLDKHGLLRLSRGKTNGKYVRETRQRSDQCAVWLRQTADAFEQSYFGRHDIPADVFRQLWAQNAELEDKAIEIGAAE